MSSVNQLFCIDASGDPNNLGKLILYKYHGGANQQYRFEPDGMGNYRIINCQSNGSLEASKSNDPGQQCYIDKGGYGGSSWKIVPGQDQASGKGFSICQANGAFCLDAKGGSVDDGVPIILWMT